MRCQPRRGLANEVRESERRETKRESGGKEEREVKHRDRERQTERNVL